MHKKIDTLASDEQKAFLEGMLQRNVESNISISVSPQPGLNTESRDREDRDVRYNSVQWHLGESYNAVMGSDSSKEKTISTSKQI
jgi:hypothetical protein